MLVGRESEKRDIARLVAGARVGHSGVLVLTGEPGIGKTALLEHAQELAVDMRVLRAAGRESEKDVAFGGLLQLLRPTLGVMDGIPEPQAEALAVALALRDGPAGDRFAVGAATLSLLSRFAEDHPLLILIDDAHQLDRPSAEAVVFVARRLMADPIAVLAVARSGVRTAVTDGELAELRVEGLDLGAAGRLMTQRVQGFVSADTVERLHRATGGNPLAMMDLTGDVDRLERISPETPLPVTDALAAAFAERAAQLDCDARTALLLAAIADGDLGVVARACRSRCVNVSALTSAERADLVHLTAARVEFRHPLVRSAVYGIASAEERRRGHRSIAEALPAHDLERRGWNLCEATVGPDDAVAVLLELVGTRARSRRAPDVAATALERAALLSSQDTARSGRFVAAGEAAWLAGQSGRAADLLASAVRAGPLGSTAQARVQELRGAIAAANGSLLDALDILLATARGEASTDPDHAVILLSDAIQACFHLGDAAAALRAADDIDRLLTGSVAPRSRVLGTMAAGIAHVLAGTGGIDRIRRAVDDLSSAAELQDDPLRPAWLVLGPLFLRESVTGRESVQRAIDQLRHRAEVGALPSLLFHLARDDATTDRWSFADAGYQESIRLARETGQTTELSLSLAGLAWLQARSGHEEDCRSNAAEASALGERHHIHLSRAWAVFALGELELGQGRPARAVLCLQELMWMLQEIGIQDVDLSPGPELAEALSRVGRGDEARHVAQAYHQRAVLKGQPWAIARAERALGITCRENSGEQHFRLALDLHDRSPDIFERARTQLAFGAGLRRARRRVDARPLLRSAMDTFDGLGAGPWADFAAVEINATGATARRRGAGAAELLTAQELQIARMLVDGRTTRQAAAALFLSPKTIEYHLRHVYTKLDIGSRSELADSLLRDAQATP